MEPMEDVKTDFFEGDEGKMGLKKSASGHLPSFKRSNEATKKSYWKSHFNAARLKLLFGLLCCVAVALMMILVSKSSVKNNQKPSSHLNGALTNGRLIEQMIQRDTFMTMKVMTFNLRYAHASDGMNSWQYRKQHVFDIINRYHPVVMGTQEGLKDQLSEIEANINHMYQRFGVERETDGEHVQIFYDSAVVDRLNGGNFWLSDHPNLPGQLAWEAPCVRMVTYCKFSLRSTGRIFWFFNTQFDHMSKKSRVNSAKLLWAKIQELTDGDKDAPIFIVGDFNTYRSTWEYQYLSTTKDGGSNFAEAWMTADQQIGDVSFTFHGFQGRSKREEAGAQKGQHHIDWIFFRPREMKTLKTEVITDTRSGGYYPSDHYPIYAEFLLKE